MGTHLPKMMILTKCAYIATAAQTGVFHHAVKHQTLVASRSAYQLRNHEVWCLTAKWKCLRRALRCMTQDLTHQKFESAIAPNLPKRRHERLIAGDIKPLAHSKHRRRRRGAPPSPASAHGDFVAGLSLVSSAEMRAPPSIILSFNFQALKSCAFNFQHAVLNLHHRSWSRTE